MKNEQLSCRIGKVTIKKTGQTLHLLPSRNRFENTTTQLLQEALGHARNGKIIACGIFAIHHDGATYTEFSQSCAENWIHAIASSSDLAYRVLKESHYGD